MNFNNENCWIIIIRIACFEWNNEWKWLVSSKNWLERILLTNIQMKRNRISQKNQRKMPEKYFEIRFREIAVNFTGILPKSFPIRSVCKQLVDLKMAPNRIRLRITAKLTSFLSAVWDEKPKIRHHYKIFLVWLRTPLANKENLILFRWWYSSFNINSIVYHNFI